MVTGVRTREEIVAAADELFYRRGFEHTSFAVIAERVGISRGNFYHHFKSKDEILAAVIEARQRATWEMIAGWEAQEATPLGRIGCFVRIVITNGEAIRHFGCPVGTLTSELAKLDHACTDQARGVFGIFRRWLADQFAALGQDRARADEFAMHVLAFSQGVATLFNAFGDEVFVEREVERMNRWLTAHAPPGDEN